MSPQTAPCPRCNSARLTIVYYDAEGRPVGGHVHCSECGARHNVPLQPQPSVQGDLLERKAS